MITLYPAPRISGRRFRTLRYLELFRDMGLKYKGCATLVRNWRNDDTSHPPIIVMTSVKDLKKKSLNRRTNSLGACKTCRRRHVKCDQTRPICRTCRAADVTCEGLASAIQWMGPSLASSDRVSEAKSGPNVRRQLYTDQERETMSSALVSGLASYSIDHFLNIIDTRSNDLHGHTEGGTSIGPFGVLNLLGDPTPTTTMEEASRSQVTIGSLLPGPEEHLSVNHESLPELSTAEEVLGNLDNYLQWADIFNLEPGTVGWTFTPPASGYEDDCPILWDSLTRPNMSTYGPSYPSPQHDLPILECTMGNIDILSEANFLLRHFHDHVVPQVIWVPMTQKSPWTILNIPAAMITLDQVTYMKQRTIKHASLSNLYAILACASYHLAMNPEFAPDKHSQYWEQLTTTFHDEAKAHLDRSLEFEFEGPTKAKYKEQLMAILGLTTYSMLSQNQTETRYHLINMEYLIRLRGLVKPKLSRRIRLLHHQYTWIRILTESTLVIHSQIVSAPCKALWSRRLDMQEMNRLAQRRATIPPYEESRGLDDFLRITPTESDADLNIDDPKDSQASIGDIHLVDSRNYPDEQHTAINGVSETWLGLLSQTTRLANVTDQLHSGSCVMTAERQLALHRRSLYLENMICSFTSRRLPLSHGKPTAHMSRALNSALVIYFYRRVRQVNPCILQGYVAHIIEELHKWDAALTQHGFVGPGTAWPAFMAGCEANGRGDRERIMQWLDKASKQSGFASCTAAKHVMEEIWKRRENKSDDTDSPLMRMQPGGPMSFSWMAYSKRNLQWLLLF